MGHFLPSDRSLLVQDHCSTPLKRQKIQNRTRGKCELMQQCVSRQYLAQKHSFPLSNHKVVIDLFTQNCRCANE